MAQAVGLFGTIVVISLFGRAPVKDLGKCETYEQFTFIAKQYI
jgi:hypothetical protein